MKRTTVSLPDSVSAAVQREAKRRNSTVSEVTRRALITYLDLDNEGPRHLPFESIFHSGQRNIARDMDKILAEEWADAIDRDRDP